MKLRLRGNTIRLRLEQQEVNSLALGQTIEEQLTFPASPAFLYRLGLSLTRKYSAKFENGAIDIRVPLQEGKAWAESEEVGLYHDFEDGPLVLKLAVEKDFQCLHKRPLEDESDMYPNPQA